MTQDANLRWNWLKSTEEDIVSENIDKEFVLNSLGKAIEDNKVVFTYQVVENPRFLKWIVYTGSASMLTVMMKALPVMSNNAGRNSIDFKDLDIYLVSHNVIGDVGLIQNITGLGLIRDDFTPLVQSYFAKHNAMAQLPHNSHHTLLNLI